MPLDNVGLNQAIASDRLIGGTPLTVREIARQLAARSTSPPT